MFEIFIWLWNQAPGAAFSFLDFLLPVLLTQSQNAIITTQGKILNSVGFAMWRVSHCRVESISVSFSICLGMWFFGVHACVSVYCTLFWETNAVKARFRQSAQTWEQSTAKHNFWASAVNCFPHMPSHPHFDLFQCSCINPFMSPTISAPALYLNVICDAALTWLTHIAAAQCWIIDRCERLWRWPLLEVNCLSGMIVQYLLMIHRAVNITLSQRLYPNTI